ncbi:MAG TPA: von Willebrand factor type A domain-containing protein, partial [Opitutales bacterium]|nr:von Willebrand factor type A domain-containing protein [Opitutales bacterium]
QSDKKAEADSVAGDFIAETASESRLEEAESVAARAATGPVDPFSAPVPARKPANLKSDRQAAELADLSKAGRRNFLNGDYDAAEQVFDEISGIDPDNAEANLFANRIDSIQTQVGEVKSREEMIRQVSQSWERPTVSAMAAIADSGLQNKTAAIVFPKLRFNEMPLSRALETLSELSAVYDPEGIGLNIVPIYDESENDPLVSLSLEDVSLGDAIAELSRAAGYEYQVDRDAIVIDKDKIPTEIRSSNRKLNNIIIPQVNFSGMPLSKVVETLEELSVVYDPQQKGVPMEYRPGDGEDPRVNISLRNLNLNRILQFVTQQVNYSYDTVGDEFIRVQPATPMTAIEEMAEARAAKVRQTPKPEKLAAEEPFSTFSLNISDVSFKLAQAALQNSRVPPSSQIRTEEFVNSFDYGDPAPRPGEAVGLDWEIAQHPFEHDRQVVRFSLQTQASGRASGQPLNLNLLVDNSGSMQRPDRQAILQNSLQTLEAKLTPQDKLNVILFARQPKLIAEAQSRESQRAAVATALAYRPEGGTNLEAGLQAAYESARRNYLESGGNRVILMTDGAANLGNVNAGELAELVVEQRKQGIALDAYGIGWDDYNDALLEEITRNGDGRYAFLNSVEDASEDFAEKLAGTLRVAAANVKVQIEWNPQRVKRYRQIGYDLHQLKKEDFRDNTVDAAEIGEAESGTAVYVLQVDEDPEIVGGLGTLRVRYLDPSSGLYKERSWPLTMPRQVPAARNASPSMRLALSSALFGERLADSPFAGGYSLRDLYSMTSGLPKAFPNQPRVAEIQTMILQASELYGENE